MKKLLITGFEPFGGEVQNPSWDAVALLPDQIAEYALCKLRCRWYLEKPPGAPSSPQKKRSPMRSCVGQAGGKNAVTPELVGINLMHAAIPDNGGNQPLDEPILPGGSAAYFSTLPVRRMAAAIVEAGIPAKLSYSAGTYVCNNVPYSLLAHYSGSHTRVGFIHVPFVPKQAKMGRRHFRWAIW